jgi:hypothetical protein
VRFYYADAGLLGQAGHHAAQCRAICAELADRGIATTVLGFAALEPGLGAALKAEPLFRWYRYRQSDGDPARGWFNAFEQGAQATREDLARLPAIGADDVLYLASAGATQLMGALLWLGDRAPGHAPRLVMDFGMDPGVDAEPSPRGGVRIVPRDPRVEATAALCQQVGQRLRAVDATRINIGYILANGAKVYAALLGHPVVRVPAWEQAVTARRDRTAKRPIVVAVLGHQRNPDKGYHLAPEVARGLLASRDDVEFLAHNANPDDMAEAQQALRALAAAEPRVRLAEGAVDGAGWRALLDAADLVLCPYSPRRYQLLSSGLHFEALANAIPAVVPAGSSLAILADDLGAATVTFARNDAAAVLEATRGALDRFDDLAASAHAAAARWPLHHGPRRFVDSLLARAGVAG